MPNGHGGARPGAGRKTTQERFGQKVETTESKIASRLARTVENLTKLADGENVIVEEEWVPAGLVFVDSVLKYSNGQPMVGPTGGPLKTKVLAFPDKKPDELVLVKRKRIGTGRDRQANIYLIDRILGKPVTPVPPKDEGDTGTEDALSQLRKFLGLSSDHSSRRNEVSLDAVSGTEKNDDGQREGD